MIDEGIPPCLFFFGRQVTDRFFFFFGFESFTTDRIGSTPTRIALIASTRLESIQSDEWIALKMVSESTLKVTGWSNEWFGKSYFVPLSKGNRMISNGPIKMNDVFLFQNNLSCLPNVFFKSFELSNERCSRTKNGGSLSQPKNKKE